MAEQVKDGAEIVQSRIEREPEPTEDLNPNIGGSMLDSALYNLNIAQQYIDETAYLAEHRLISFHHGIALLARYRNDPGKLAVAHQCLTDAANWQISEKDWDTLGGSYMQIVCEAHYNLGVIEEIRKRFDRAVDHYEHAIDIDKRIAGFQSKRHCRSPRPTGVEVLAKFGSISAAISLIDELSKASERHGDFLLFASQHGITKARVRRDLDNLLSLVRILTDGKTVKFEGIGTPVAQQLPKGEELGAGKRPLIDVIKRLRRKLEEPIPLPVVAEVNAVLGGESHQFGNLTLRHIEQSLDDMRNVLNEIKLPDEASGD
jgi:hypothetical protein